MLPPKLIKEKLLKYFVILYPLNVLNPTTNHIIIVFERQASIVMAPNFMVLVSFSSNAAESSVDGQIQKASIMLAIQSGAHTSAETPENI